MKKIISFMIVAVLFVSCMIPAAFAFSGSVSADTKTVEAGATVQISVYLNAEDVAGGELYIGAYDSSVLTLVESVKGNTPGYADSFNGNTQFANADAYSGSYTICTVTFTVAADAAPGTYSIPFSGTVSDATLLNDQAVSCAGAIVIPAPETEPTTAPETEPTTAPTTEPTTAPTTEPTTAPTTEPTTAPTIEPPVTEPGDIDPVPTTGDITPHIMMAVAAVIAMGAAAMFVFKRKAAK